RRDAARAALTASGLPVARALLLLGDRAAASRDADAILESVSHEMPTFDRALTLVWVQKALGSFPAPPPATLSLGTDWMLTTSWMGDRVWRFTGQGRTGALELGAAPTSSGRRGACGSARQEQRRGAPWRARATSPAICATSSRSARSTRR